MGTKAIRDHYQSVLFVVELLATQWPVGNSYPSRPLTCAGFKSWEGNGSRSLDSRAHQRTLDVLSSLSWSIGVIVARVCLYATLPLLQNEAGLFLTWVSNWHLDFCEIQWALTHWL